MCLSGIATKQQELIVSAFPLKIMHGCWFLEKKQEDAKPKLA